MSAARYTHGYCSMCEKHDYVGPLHGERGGPLCCLLCIGKWDAEHAPLRRARRVLIKALKAYEAVGGSLFREDFNKLQLIASGLFGGNADSTDFSDLTSELLTATLALTHPDKHPPERKAEASRVTQELLALKPFVFPAPEPEPPPKPKPNDVSLKERSDDLNKPSWLDYPCEDCRDTIPGLYCDPCKAQWEKDKQKDREREEKKRVKKNARQRELYKRNSGFRLKDTTCATCGETFKRKRNDTQYCSAACRQRAYVKRDGKASNTKPLGREEIERAVANVLASNPDSAFTTDDLCDRVYLGLNRPERKHRAAVTPIAKKVCERLGEHWEWWRSEKRGGVLVFLNRASVTSYAMARLKSDLYMCRPDASEDDMKAKISQGGHYHKYVVEGGAWWEHCQEAVAKLKEVTAKQNAAGGNSTSRHAERAT